MNWLKPITMAGTIADLVPLSPSHLEDLAEAVSDGELWKLWYTFIPEPDHMLAEIERRLKLEGEGSMLPFSVLEKVSGKVVGMTTYMNLDPAARRLEIGSTWYRKGVQGTGLNWDCKAMLLSYAFEELDCVAVEFRTSFFNHQSRRAIEKLGAKLDGVLRNHTRHANGTMRDTCVYSIIESEWPTVKAHLSHLKQAYGNRDKKI